MSIYKHLFVRTLLLRLAIASMIIGLLCIQPWEAMSQQYDKADREFAADAYADALEHYKQALEDTDSDSAYLHYRIGECYLRMNHPEEALSWLIAAQQSGYNQPHLLYSLGETCMLLGKYNQALGYFGAYARQQPDDKRTAVKIVSCHLAQDDSSSNPAYTISPVDVLSTTGSEYGIAYQNNQWLTYASTGANTPLSHRKTSARTGMGYSKLYIARINPDGTFAPGTLLRDVSGDKVNRGVLSYDPHTDRYYCTTCQDSKEDCYISILSIDDNQFRELGQLEIGNIDAKVGHPFVTNNGNTLYFTSSMEGGYGGDDIWYSHRQDNGEWGKPINAGPEINTVGNEVFPNVYSDYLIFASDGWPGYGGLDLYVSKINSDSSFAKAVNLRRPFNSEKDDFNLIVNPKAPGGLLVSNRNNEHDSDNIYQFTRRLCVINIKGVVYDKATGHPLPHATITLLDSTDQITQTAVTDSLGAYNIALQPGNNYRTSASLAGYTSQTGVLDTRTTSCFTEVSTATGYATNFYLEKPATPIPEYTLVVKDIYYEFGLSRITPQAATELSKVAEVLKQYPHTTLQIASHTDSRGSYSYNKNLSKARARSAAKYIEQQGIDPKRIETIGYGESQPVIAHPKNEEEHQLNRRTVFGLNNYTAQPNSTVQVVHTQDLLRQQSPSQIAGIAGWWLRLATTRRTPTAQLKQLERQTGMPVQAIRLDHEWTLLCTGPFATSEQAQQTMALLRDKGIDATLEYIPATE